MFDLFSIALTKQNVFFYLQQCEGDVELSICLSVYLSMSISLSIQLFIYLPYAEFGTLIRPKMHYSTITYTYAFSLL